MAKKDDQVHLEFLNNAEDVTGSCTIIKFLDRTILFEFGGIQSGHTPIDNYKLNKAQISKVKAKDVDMIICGHMHYDHIGNIPALTKANPNIRTIIPQDSYGILREMWLDSAGINERDCEEMSNIYPDKVFIPSYTIPDANEALNTVEEFNVGQIYALDDNISIRYTYSGHIFGACQCELYIKIKNVTKKILFTSDLGNLKIADNKPFVQKFIPVDHADIVIAECTYGSRDNLKVTPKIVNKDLEKIESVVNQFCRDIKQRVLFPVFSLDKCPNILWMLYNMFGKDETFDTKIVIDSPLTNRLLDRYGEVLTGEAKELYDEMLSWKNIVRIIEPEDSKNAVSTMNNCVILSSSGMLTQGRSVKWCKSVLPKAENCIICTGYAPEGSLAWMIKNCSDKKTINIAGMDIKNRAQVINIRSMSSHMQREDMIEYYSNINTKKIYLVHGEMNGKVEFAQDLKEELSKKSKSTQVCVVNNATKINL